MSRGAITAFHDLEPVEESFREAVLEGLGARPKAISSKFIYDARGSELFAAVTGVEEYYPTRTEIGILGAQAEAIARRIGPACQLIEYGSGSSIKTRLLLDERDDWAAYVPIDISREHLLRSADALRARYPGLEVLTVCGDYTDELAIPAASLPVRRRVVFFPGSTIGNLLPREAESFLKHVASTCGVGGALLIGVDLHKDVARLEAAYDDAQGVSAAFALNLLERMNRELEADFDLKRFGYQARYDEAEHRIVMSIESLEDQTVHVGGAQIEFEEGELMRTEYSYKYTLEEFADLASAAGFVVEDVWTDDERLFSLQYLTTV